MRVPDPVPPRDAVREVILQNRQVWYSPARFVQLTENGEVEDWSSAARTWGTIPPLSTYSSTEWPRTRRFFRWKT